MMYVLLKAILKLRQKKSDIQCVLFSPDDNLCDCYGTEMILLNLADGSASNMARDNLSQQNKQNLKLRSAWRTSSVTQPFVCSQELKLMRAKILVS